MRLVICFIITIFYFPFSTFAQEKNLRLNISYFGRNFFHPGIKLGTDYPLANHQKTKTNKKGIEKIKLHQFIMQNNVAYYYHRNNQHGLLLNTELGYRFVANKGLKAEIFLGIGYQRTFLDGRVYEVTDDLQIKRVYFAGNNYFVPSVAISFGKDFYKKNYTIKAWHLKIGAFYQYPFNTKFLLNPSLELGCSFRWPKKKAK